MKKTCPQEFIDFAGKLADISGKVIKRYFRQPYDLQSKDDLSPVTIADLEAEKELRAAIMEAYPEHGIIGEEFAAQAAKSDYTWLLDPIDGTASFMIGRPIFGTLISLLDKGTPILGVIDQPITGERWLGANGETALNNVQIHTRKNIALVDAVLCTTAHDLFPAADSEFFEKIRKKARYTVYGGDCYSYGLVAAGHADIVIESGLKHHDFWALRPIIEGAGGVFCDWQGGEITLASSGQVIAAGSAELAKEILNG